MKMSNGTIKGVTEPLSRLLNAANKPDTSSNATNTEIIVKGEKFEKYL